MNGEAPTNADFDLEDEYKPEPLMRKGDYTGNVTKVSRDDTVITWQVTLEGNEEQMMSDGETPIDGFVGYSRNFLPKDGDKQEPTKDGRGTKHQVKINMLKQFADEMQIDMNTLDRIDLAIENGDWMGIPVVCSIEPEEYQGRHSNRIQRMIAQVAETEE